MNLNYYNEVKGNYDVLQWNTSLQITFRKEVLQVFNTTCTSFDRSSGGNERFWVSIHGLELLVLIQCHLFSDSGAFSLTSAAASEATEANIASAPLQGRELTAYWAMTHVMDVVKCLCCRLV